jgi:HD-like signal output (HDOD) protein
MSSASAARASTPQDLRNAVAFALSDGSVPVPVLPQVATRAFQAAADETVDAARLAGIVQTDPSLSAQVLRIANSAAYAPRMPIGSLTQAISYLGLSNLRQITLAASIQASLFKVPGFEGELGAIWRQAVGSALFAREVALLRQLDPDEAFMCGLLHRIGAPVLLQLAIDEATRLGLALGAPDVRETIALVVHQAATMAGTLVASAWNLPPTVVACIAGHDNPESAGAHARLAAAVWVAARHAEAALAQTPLPAPAAGEAPIAHVILSLGPAELGRLDALTPLVRQRVAALTS